MSKQLVKDSAFEEKHDLISAIEEFLTDYAAFEDVRIALPLALWTVATHCFQKFDAFPYIVITSLTKRSGKTRLSELLSFMASNPMSFSAMTPSTLFRSINPPDDWRTAKFIPPTILFDEAETLSNEGASTMRAVLNAGYRKGQSVPRTVGLQVIQFKVYCPKVFILIGDVYDTLRDRSIVIMMRRAEPRKRFLYDETMTRGEGLRERMKQALSPAATLKTILAHYHADRAQYLSDRDEEIWSSLFAICKAFCPDRYRDLQRIAVDLCALKTATKRKHVSMDLFDSQTEQEEYAKQALRDLAHVINGDKSIFSEVAVMKMRELDLSPWRTFRGPGLDANSLADLVSQFGVRPVVLRSGEEVKRGYRKLDIDAALAIV